MVDLAGTIRVLELHLYKVSNNLIIWIRKKKRSVFFIEQCLMLTVYRTRGKIWRHSGQRRHLGTSAVQLLSEGLAFARKDCFCLSMVYLHLVPVQHFKNL